jgi:DNA-directed RNA polymerase subunit RPC12/RpoP
MLKIQAGEYECVQCKKLTIIPRTKKSEEPLTCCGVEMVPKEKVKFTEPPAPKATATAATKTKTKSKTRTATATRKKAADGKRPKKAETIVEAITLPLAPGNYMCPTCGATKVLQVSDNRDKWLRCSACFVKMLPS